MFFSRVNYRKIVTFFVLFNFLDLYTSEKESMSSQSFSAALTGQFFGPGFTKRPEELAAMKEKQAKTIAREDLLSSSVVEVCTDTTLYGMVNQFLEKKFYKGVDLEIFSQTHPAIIERWKIEAGNYFSLDSDNVDFLYKGLSKKPERRKFGCYKIVGCLPEEVFVEDQGTIVSYRDSIVLKKDAYNHIFRNLKNYIDEHEQAVLQACQSSTFQPSRSKEVLTTFCCQLAVHEKCLLAARFHKTDRCPNGQCDYGQPGKMYPKWREGNFSSMLEQQPLASKKIPNSTCAFCSEGLNKSLEHTKTLSHSRKKQKLDF